MRLEESCVPAERSIMDHKCPSGPRPSLFSLYLFPSFYFFYVMCMPQGSSWIINVERFNATYRRNIADVHRDAASEPFTAGWPELQVKFKHNCTIKLRCSRSQLHHKEKDGKFFKQKWLLYNGYKWKKNKNKNHQTFI